MWRELPPTAGLPLRAGDFLPFHSVPSLESQLARMLGVSSVQIECSGTAALVIALEYLKSKSRRRQVVIPGFTCPLVLIAVHQAGLEPVLCDTQPDAFDFDKDQLARCVTDDTLAVIPTHIGGLPVDLTDLLPMAHQRGAFVIEDAAQALGAVDNERPVGTAGDIGIFSLSVGKGLSIYQGGFMVAQDATVRQGLLETSQRISRSHPLIETRRLAELVAYLALYNPFGLSFSYGWPRRSALRAGQFEQAVGDVFDLTTELAHVSDYRKRVGALAARRLPEFLADNQSRGRRLAKQLVGINQLHVFEERSGCLGSWPFLTVLFDKADDCDRALAQLWQSHLGVTQLFVRALSQYQYLSPLLPADSSVPNAESLARRCMTVSNSGMMLETEFYQVAEQIKAACHATPSHGRVGLEATL